MEVNIYTWGTGGAFGRELGTIPNDRKRRDHSAVSIIGMDNGQANFHFMIDAGAPCVEKMIDNQISACPELLFITHTHNDHISDFDKLVNSRKRGLSVSKGKASPLIVVCTSLCADDPVFGLKARFGYLGDSIRFLTVPCFDVWYSIKLLEGRMLPSNLSEGNGDYPVEFKLVPVYHASHAPGACMFIFRIKDSGKRIVVSGDFETIEDRWIDNPDLKDPDIMLLETNTIKATGTGHTNWQQNMKLLGRWLSPDSKSKVLITHLSGYEDWSQKYYSHIPSDKDWLEAVSQFQAPRGANIEIAEDGKCYPVPCEEHVPEDSVNEFKQEDCPAGSTVECRHEKTRIEGLGADSPCIYEGIEVCEHCGIVIRSVKTKECSECPYDGGDECYDRHRWYNR